MEHNQETHTCPWWYAYTFDNVFRRLFQKPELILADWVKQGMTVLDLGCGMGFYSIAMAKMVGPEGRVVSVDLQQKMLDVMQKRAARKGVVDRIEPVLADQDDINFSGETDFAIAMWMVHEVADKEKFFSQVRNCLKTGAGFLIAEPSFHISRNDFAKELKIAAQHGLLKKEEPRVGLSRAAVIVKKG